MPSLGAETSAVQYPMIRYAQDIGWKLVSQAEALRRRAGETDISVPATWTFCTTSLYREKHSQYAVNTAQSVAPQPHLFKNRNDPLPFFPRVTVEPVRAARQVADRPGLARR